MIGIRPISEEQAQRHVDTFLERFPDAEARRTRALGFIPVNGEVKAEEQYPTRVVLAAQWADPADKTSENSLPPLIETAHPLYNIGYAVDRLAGQKAVVFRGFDPHLLWKEEALQAPQFGFSIDIGTLTGKISPGLRRPANNWRENRGLPDDAALLEFQLGIETTGVQRIEMDFMGETQVRIPKDTAIPYYAGKVSLSPSKDLYRRARETTLNEDIVFGNQHCFDVMNKLAKRAGELGLGDQVFPDLDFSE